MLCARAREVATYPPLHLISACPSSESAPTYRHHVRSDIRHAKLRPEVGPPRDPHKEEKAALHGQRGEEEGARALQRREGAVAQRVAVRGGELGEVKVGREAGCAGGPGSLDGPWRRRRGGKATHWTAPIPPHIPVMLDPSSAYPLYSLTLLSSTRPVTHDMNMAMICGDTTTLLV